MAVFMAERSPREAIRHASNNQPPTAVACNRLKSRFSFWPPTTETTLTIVRNKSESTPDFWKGSVALTDPTSVETEVTYSCRPALYFEIARAFGRYTEQREDAAGERDLDGNLRQRDAHRTTAVVYAHNKLLASTDTHIPHRT